MTNGDYVTKEYLSQELEKFGKRLKDSILSGVKEQNTEMLRIFLNDQKKYIDNKLDSINLIATANASGDMDFRIKLLEGKVKNLMEKVGETR